MNTENNKLKFIIPAILLILPVVLILIFDPAAWLSKSNLVSDILGMILFVDVPIGMCLWHWFKPEHFREWRWMIPFGLMTLGCWAAIAGGMWLACKTGHGPDNGFAAVCAYAFGWAYIWLTMIPIGAVYVVFRAILKLIQKCRGTRTGRNDPGIADEQGGLDGQKRVNRSGEKCREEKPVISRRDRSSAASVPSVMSVRAVKSSRRTGRTAEQEK